MVTGETNCEPTNTSTYSLQEATSLNKTHRNEEKCWHYNS